jgi:hydrogenase maturation protease
MAVLVVGVGSELRGDDAAGRRVAAAVDARGLDGVRVRSVPQLVPELAVDLAGCDRVVFVDAGPDDREVTVRAVDPAQRQRRLTHQLDVASLLELTALTGTPPEAIVVTVPAADFTVGGSLSARTAHALGEAVDRVVSLCRGLPAPRQGNAPPACDDQGVR